MQQTEIELGMGGGQAPHGLSSPWGTLTSLKHQAPSGPALQLAAILQATTVAGGTHSCPPALRRACRGGGSVSQAAAACADLGREKV